MGGKTDRDAVVALIKQARRHSRLIPGGVEVAMSVRALALAMSSSKRSAEKAIARLKDAKWLSRGQKGSGTKAGTFILKRRAGVGHSNQLGGSEKPTEASVLPLRAPFTAPRLRWSAPGIARLGKTCGAVLDYLERVGGSATVEELADAAGVARVRDFRRRTVARLEAAGVVECAGETVTLAGDWLGALDRERERGGEVAATRRDLARFNRERVAFRNRYKNRPDESPSEEQLEKGREAWQARRAASGEISELERVPEPLSVRDLDALVDKPVETTAGRGRLWQVFSDRVGVVLDDAPATVTFLPLADVLGSPGEAKKRRLTENEAREVERLVSEGMSETFARAAVTGEAVA
jgi:hypothetical protein